MLRFRSGVFDLVFVWDDDGGAGTLDVPAGVDGAGWLAEDGAR